MKLRLAVCLVWWARNVKRSWKAMNATKSTTTQNVAIASTPAAALVTLLSVIRAILPDLMPWPPSVDAAGRAADGGPGGESKNCRVA